MADGTLKVGTITTSSGSGTITLGQSGETISIPSGATVSGAGANTPYFKVGIATMSLPYNTVTKITYSNEITDTAGAYDPTTNYRFTVPTGEAGTYHIGAWYRTGTGTDISAFEIYLYKNGSIQTEDIAAQSMSYSYNSVGMFGAITLADGDYLECYAKQASVAGSYDIGYSNQGRFFGYKLIGI